MLGHFWMISADGTGFSFIFLKKIVLLLLLVCTGVRTHMCGPCHSMPQKSEDTFVESVLSFYLFIDSEGGTQVPRHG